MCPLQKTVSRLVRRKWKWTVSHICPSKKDAETPYVETHSGARIIGFPYVEKQSTKKILTGISP
jgi:hypothetical protein